MEDKIIEALSKYSNFNWSVVIKDNAVLIIALLTVNDRPMVVRLVHALAGFEDRMLPATIEYVVSEIADAIADRLIRLEEND